MSFLIGDIHVVARYSHNPGIPVPSLTYIPALNVSKCAFHVSTGQLILFG